MTDICPVTLSVNPHEVYMDIVSNTLTIQTDDVDDVTAGTVVVITATLDSNNSI